MLFEFEYDDGGRLTLQRIDGLFDVTSRLTWSEGLLVELLADRSTRMQRWTFTWSPAGRLLTSVEDNGPERLLEEVEHDYLPDGRRSVSRNLTTGHETRYLYDGAQLIEEQEVRAGEVTWQRWYEYDGERRVASLEGFDRESARAERVLEWDERANPTRLQHAERGEILGESTPTYVYDADGNLVEETRTRADGTTYFHQRRTYDPQGRETRRSTNPGMFDEELREMEYEGDRLVLERIDGGFGDIFEGRFDRFRELEYDADGRLVRERLVAGPPLLSDTDTYRYDDDGRLVWSRHESWHIEGHLAYEVALTWAGDRLTERRSSDSDGAAESTVTWDYDTAGRLVAAREVDAHGVTAWSRSMEYDDSGRRVREQHDGSRLWGGADDGVDLTVVYEYECDD